MNAAVDRIGEQPGARVYLDGTHSAWLGSGDIARRLVLAGVERAAGFYLNVSNYQFSTNSRQFGSWVSACITYATEVAAGDYLGCPNQYWNGGPLPSKIAQLLGEWTGVALSAYGEWSDGSDDPALNTSGINLRYANMLGAVATTRFVVDTSRNGVGPWAPPAGHPPGDPQDWCNPPDRGLGSCRAQTPARRSIDAWLWVKIPARATVSCNRWAPPGAPDPVRGVVDPGAACGSPTWRSSWPGTPP